MEQVSRSVTETAPQENNHYLHAVLSFERPLVVSAGLYYTDKNHHQDHGFTCFTFESHSGGKGDVAAVLPTKRNDSRG
jgi:hypothetical protein